MITILGAEHVGAAKTVNGILDIGGVKVHAPWWNDGMIHVYVRRSSKDLSVMEIHMTRHDGLAQEELDRQNDEAGRYPLGPKEYWRAETVGKCTIDGRLMTDEDFDNDWGV